MSAQRPQSPYGGPMPASEQPPRAAPSYTPPGSLPAPTNAAPTRPTLSGQPPVNSATSSTKDPYSRSTNSKSEIDELAPAAPTTPYDFFMGVDQQAPAKKGLGLGIANGPNKQMILIAGGGLLVVLILGSITLFAPKENPKVQLVSTNQAQIETLRVCTAGQRQLRDTSLRGFASNCSLVMTTESQRLTTYLTKAKINLKGKVLQRGYNKKTDAALAAATSSSDYDDAFKSVMLAQLTTQGRAIQAALKQPSTTSKEKTQLTDYLNATKLLAKQLTNGDGVLTDDGNIDTTGNTSGTRGTTSTKSSTDSKSNDSSDDSSSTTSNPSKTKSSSSTKDKSSGSSTDSSDSSSDSTDDSSDTTDE